MEEFRRQFLSETVETLENLKRKLPGAEINFGSMKREIFRTLHTVKGTAQTFGFDEASHLAHELETLLSVNENAKTLLLEGIELLQKSLVEEAFEIPEKFIETLRSVIPNAEQISKHSNYNSLGIPSETHNQLSAQEKQVIATAIRAGKSFALLEIGFETANFATELIKFRELLNLTGEIIATFPSAKFNNEGKIGFQFLTASSEGFEGFAAENSANVLWKFSPPKFVSDIHEILQQVTRHGEEVSAKFGKQIEITTETDRIDFSRAELKLVFEVLLHLVRNAVDHAIESVGKIEIQIKKESNGLRLSISDDGRGIDLERIKTKAIERNLISNAENLSEAETLDLIFQPEFSTKSEATEISGRGIGLDVVKDAVEKSGGEITVSTEKEKGTTFEIFLPRKESWNE